MITIGADPEVFVKHSNTNLITTAIGKLGGSKEYPRPVTQGYVQEDNVLAEFNIAPATSPQQFIANINTVYEEMTKILNKEKCEPIIMSSHRYTIEYLKSVGHQALEFGCSVEFDAWQRRPKKAPAGTSTGLRTAGGHVHVGYEDHSAMDNYLLAQMLDFTLGLPSVIMDNDRDRRSLYGTAGSMRHKAYGMEYRVLSNFWLKSDELKDWVFRTTKWTKMNLDLLVEYLVECPEAVLKKTINTSNVKKAKSLCKDLQLEYIE